MHATYRPISQPPFFSFFSFWKNTQIKLIRLHHFGERGRTRRLALSVAMADKANAVLAIAALPLTATQY
jgi:hypothetical protein